MSDPSETHSTSSYAYSSCKYWCSSCTREFSQLKFDPIPSQAHCPRCDSLCPESSTISHNTHNPPSTHPQTHPFPSQETSQNSQFNHLSDSQLFFGLFLSHILAEMARDPPTFQASEVSQPQDTAMNIENQALISQISSQENSNLSQQFESQGPNLPQNPPETFQPQDTAMNIENEAPNLSQNSSQDQENSNLSQQAENQNSNLPQNSDQQNPNVPQNTDSQNSIPDLFLELLLRGAIMRFFSSSAFPQHFGVVIYTSDGIFVEEFFRDDPNQYGAPPASQEAINGLQQVKFETSGLNTGSCCAICMEGYQESEDLSILPCKHNYHQECVKTWLVQHNSCPNCRQHI